MAKYFVKKNGKFTNEEYDLMETDVENIVAYMQRKEPDATFELLAWTNNFTVDTLKVMEENHLLRKVNWNWDNKYKKEN